MTSQEFTSTYWSYYKNLEKDFIRTFEYLTVDNDNFAAYSVEFTKIMQTVCSEIDVICKEYCVFWGINDAESINMYSYVITRNVPTIKLEAVHFVGSNNIILTPWKDWEWTENIDKRGRTSINGTPPFWWSIYNKVKHQRTTLLVSYGKPFFKFANLENVLNALSALFSLEMHFFRSIIMRDTPDFPLYPDNRSEIFDFPHWDEEHVRMDQMYGFVTEKE